MGESSFKSGNEIENSYSDNSHNENNINEGTVNNSSPHSIKIYQITDPDNLGTPYFADESGLRVGLDFNYRDHRPGINKPWLNSEDDTDDNSIDNTADNTYDKSILDLFTGSEEGTEDAENSEDDIDLNSDTDRYAIDIIEFYSIVFENEILDTIRFDITEAVQAWAIGNSENQGLFITTAQGWTYGEYLTLSGMTAEDEDKRPYIEVIYSDNDSADLIAPESVGEVTIEPGTDSITLNWINPDLSNSTNSDIAGVKMLLREGIVPFDEQDGDFVAFIDDITSSSGKYIDTGLTTGQTYYYAIYTYDNEHNYSSKVWIKGSPGSPAEAPVFDNPVVGQGTVSLSWNQVDGAEDYRVYREDSSGNIKLLNETRRDQDLSLLNHVTEGEYIYFLTAVNQYGEGPFSEKVSVFVNDPAAEVPDAPSELSGQGTSGSEIELSWMDNSDTEFNFVLERQNDTGDWIEVVRTEKNRTGYIDDNLLPATYYNYRIKAAENSAGSSSYSSQIFATTLDLPVEVTDISWEVISTSHVKVKWQDTTNEDSYRVELFDISADNEPLRFQTLSKNTNSCYFITLESGKEYRVRVTSIKGENSIFTESDIIRTSMDSRGGLF
ncbi:MAG: hypothetical protein ACLFPF_05870 [Halanaerobiales bacterium]